MVTSTDIAALLWFLFVGLALVAWADLTPGQTILAFTWAGVYAVLMIGGPR